MKRARDQHGFAVVELLLVAIIILAVAGIGYWVYQQRSKTALNNETPTQSLSREAAARNAAVYAQNAVEDEAKSSQASGDSESTQATSDSNIASEIGDSSNVAN